MAAAVKKCVVMTPSQPSVLAQEWARQYVESLSAQNDPSVKNPAAKRGIRASAANRLLDLLRQLSLKAWYQTESILADEIQRHGINRQLINPWEISQDAFSVYEKVLGFYMDNTAHTRLPALIGADIDKLRKKYTARDPRTIAFVSMQFHYTSSLLKGHLTPLEMNLLESCFKVIDDHLYMPLHRAYAAAGKHAVESHTLVTAQKVLKSSSVIGNKIAEEIADMYPNYKTYSGALSDSAVMASSRRDVVMFQIYLIVCILEESPDILQGELFPLCIMIYPKLKVHWELVRQMLIMIDREVGHHLGEASAALFRPYLYVLRDMFSPEVFDDLDLN
jgi:hypothetical protein